MNPLLPAPLLNQLPQEPVFQAAAIALATFTLEDAVTIASALLVAEGKLHFLTAFAGLTVGIAAGDLGLYAMGAWGRKIPWVARRVEAPQVRRVAGTVGRTGNLVSLVLLARVIPGMRIPVYCGAGLAGAGWKRFLAIAVLASTLWSLALLTVFSWLGAAAAQYLGSWRWIAFALLIGAVLWIHGHSRKLVLSASPKTNGRPYSSFEFWPPWLFYLPVGVWYILLALRYRGLLTPTCANPSIHTGGIVGESKSGILALAGPPASDSIARWTLLPADSLRNGESVRLVAEAEQRARQCGFDYPFVAKPDKGERGRGVKLIRSPEDLGDYLTRYSEDSDVMLQEYADLPGEAGVFFIRDPETGKGSIFSLTLKEFPVLRGDGKQTIRGLILGHPRFSRQRSLYFRRFHNRLDDVLPAGTSLPLVFTGNHCRGAVFRDGSREITPALTQWTEEFAASVRDFHFGRIDLRFNTLRDLREGRGLRVVEVNGAASEATHIWDPDYTLVDAWRVLFRQFSILFRTGAANRRRGARPTKGTVMIREILRHFRLMLYSHSPKPDGKETSRVHNTPEQTFIPE